MECENLKVVIANCSKVMSQSLKMIMLSLGNDVTVLNDEGESDFLSVMNSVLLEKQATDLVIMDTMMMSMEFIESLESWIKEIPELQILVLKDTWDHAKNDKLSRIERVGFLENYRDIGVFKSFQKLYEHQMILVEE